MAYKVSKCISCRRWDWVNWLNPLFWIVAFYRAWLA